MDKMITGNGYLKDKNGRVMEVVDKAARDGVERLTEEIDELKESGGSGNSWGESNAGKLLVTDNSGDATTATIGNGLELTYGAGKNIFNGVWHNAKYTNGVYEAITHGRMNAGVQELFPVTPNTKYTISRQVAPASGFAFLYPQEFDKYGSWIEGSSNISGFTMELVKAPYAVLTTGSDTHFVSFYIYGEDDWQNLVPGGFMIEKGSAPTEYEEYTVNNAVISVKKESTIPAYWGAHLDEKISQINGLHKELGKDCFSFVAIADTHYGDNLGKRSPTLAREIMDRCDIKYVYGLGDFTSSGALMTESEIETECAEIDAMFAPIRGSMLAVQGNHDGAWGWIDENGNGQAEFSELYPYNFTPGKMHKWLYRKVGLVGDVHFDETGTAYYIDDTASRVRYIALDSSCIDYVENEDGSVVYNVMKMFRFTQKQYDFLQSEALVDGLDERWNIVVGIHAPLATYETMWGTEGNEECTLMRSFLAAFKNKASFSGTFDGTAENGFDAVTVSADFTAAKASFIGCFVGHVHNDNYYPRSGYGVDMVAIGADRQREGMTVDTDTEQSFDVITVDTKNKKIYCTKIGFGEDREFTYAD